MKVGDLVRLVSRQLNPPDELWLGLVTGFWRGQPAHPVVFWCEKFPHEVEYADQLEVVESA